MTALASYQELLARKRVAFEPRGLASIPTLNAAMFPHQAQTTEFLLRSGCGAAFLDTGLGKSLVALEWGRVIAEYAGKPVLMLAPLAVGPQHQREAEKFGIEAEYQREPGRRVPIVITNYERVDKFDPDAFAGVVLDESSILKSFTGATTRKLIETFKRTPYRLACTATPAPNDHMELGNHSQFLGAMESREMLSRWFINDTSEASQAWRLKGHAVASFWDWVASWARCVSRPSDLGYSDAGFILPDLEETVHRVGVDLTDGAGEDRDGQSLMFRSVEASATSIHREKKLTVDVRADAIAEAVAADAGEPWVIWCDTDAEAEALIERIGGAVEVRGSMKPEQKEERLVAFANGDIRVLVSKPRICGYGLNWQHCARMAFVGMSYSYEAYYQAVRRCWRFGQTRPVEVHIALADTERPIFDAVRLKAKAHEMMKAEMVSAMRRAHQSADAKVTYQPRKRLEAPAWLAA
ncbi:helicase-related protein [Hyphomicrobium sp. CS1GBMeth3]|uniref:helicase-related protein n=1 Tax=Hyphomicrobium sp. CS1GBMeth3 TaxID=1892845 RepID=UPI000931176E|nr:helicase-related protein [Hyphomicrobium sp. CS1GBMeth3]